MNKLLQSVFLMLMCWSYVSAQDTTWTSVEKNALVDHYKRTRNEVNTETSNLSAAQWAFREKPDGWTIGQVLEHLNMWQLITLYNARIIVDRGARPELAPFCGSDSANVLFIYEQKPHVSPDFTVPTGFIPGVKNLDVFNFNCDKIITGIDGNNSNFKVYFRGEKSVWLENLYQTYAIQYGHVDRHLRQIKRIKSDKNFPKK